MSRGRYDTIKTHKILPSFIEVLVPESEKEMYESRIINPVITVPDSVKGLGFLRNWVLEHFPEETVIMIDDDIHYFYCLTGENTKAVDSDEFFQHLINTAVMAKDAGCHVFGFSQTDIRKYNGTQPFSLNGWVGCIIGVIGRKYRFRDDYFKVDIDMCLQSLLVDRIIWIDNRFYCSQDRDNNKGGNAKFRTKENFQRSVDSLLAKWGDCLKVSWHDNNISIKTNVKRRQDIKI